MKTSKEEADDLINEYIKYLKPFINDSHFVENEYKEIIRKEAIKGAIITVNKILSDTGSDRAYLHWSEVQEILNKK